MQLLLHLKAHGFRGILQLSSMARTQQPKEKDTKHLFDSMKSPIAT